MAHHSTTECNDSPVKTVSTETRKKNDIKLLKGDDLQEFHFKEKKLYSIQCELQNNLAYFNLQVKLVYVQTVHQAWCGGSYSAMFINLKAYS